MESLEIILKKADRVYSEVEKVKLMDRKNTYYREFLELLTPVDILPGVMNWLADLKEIGIKVAIGSSSRNTPIILDKITLSHHFDVIVDGNDISNSKPDPEEIGRASCRERVYVLV